jgi:hypothetical protein
VNTQRHDNDNVLSIESMGSLRKAAKSGIMSMDSFAVSDFMHYSVTSRIVAMIDDARQIMFSLQGLRRACGAMPQQQQAPPACVQPPQAGVIIDLGHRKLCQLGGPRRNVQANGTPRFNAPNPISSGHRGRVLSSNAH